MSKLILNTFDWVPDMPRGYVRDLRVRWALEEAGFDYEVKSVPFRERSTKHFTNQPFGQVPWLTDGELSIFESGAILLHLAERSKKLMPKEAHGRSDVIQWLFAALNSVEMASLPWSLYIFTDDTEVTPGRKSIDQFLQNRLKHMELILSEREWLTEQFSVADIAMADVLRLVDRFEGLKEYPGCASYVKRATDRPAFRKAHNDQIAHFAAGDKNK
ncbi:glutathione S-transferase family protein [Kangiella sediminilitoris]|uniref:Glutathione S-transferase n=1 Tax=Kangiella sediminilitoris TaxID=1144748 RepID=A0A1B3B7Y0_9GAMM|nr:glutathione S-transferase family protein [Kangiella sediminilitoris]AOE48904.1 glutathione S-transferase [Kangiella sediminilitoris]